MATVQADWTVVMIGRLTGTGPPRWLDSGAAPPRKHSTQAVGKEIPNPCAGGSSPPGGIATVASQRHSDPTALRRSAMRPTRLRKSRVRVRGADYTGGALTAAPLLQPGPETKCFVNGFGIAHVPLHPRCITNASPSRYSALAPSSLVSTTRPSRTTQNSSVG